MPYEFPAHDQFVNRQDELAVLQRWWEDARTRFPLVLYGRRRTGKSWLCRELAHGKEADILVCDERAERDQLDSFAESLEGRLGARLHFPTAREFFRYVLARSGSEKHLLVVDEFPLLLAQSPGADSSLAALMEEEAGRSPLRLILCGSHISTMEALLGERRPLHGRGRPMLLRPLGFQQARAYLGERTPSELIERYGIAGGMPLYLERLAQPRDLATIVCEDLLDPLGPLFNEPRNVLRMELTNTATHFSILRALSSAPELEWDELVRESKVDGSTASRNIDHLVELQLVEAANPILASEKSRKRRYRLLDPLMRFWFRFVFARQDELRSGLAPRQYWKTSIEPYLSDHLAPAFEEVCRAWVRANLGDRLDSAGRWWGLARHDLRASGARTSEEIDVVGALGRRVTVAAECKWTGRPMGSGVLDDLMTYKLPALGQTGVDVSSPLVVLFSRSGFTRDLTLEAGRRGVRLVDLEDLVAGLPATPG